ncbi:MAG TPA: PPC domain-containing protein [Herpetosiphonaceae bacterium]
MMRWIRTISILLVLLTITAAARAAQPEQGTPTATPSTTPSATATATSTPLPSPTPEPDAFEPNDTADQATPIDIGQRLDKLSFWPLGDVDYFSFVVKDGQRGMTLLLDTEHGFGLDTRMRLLTSDGQLVAENDDASPTESRSHIAVRIATAGRYVVEVTNRAVSRPEWKTYSLVTAWEHRTPTASVTPTSAPTPGPSTTPGPTATPTPPPWDRFEPNNAWAQAREIAVGEDITALNFVCPDTSGCVDNDFFQVPLKAGICYRIQTADLHPGIDTNLIVYGPGKDAAAPLGGNDDAEPGAFHSQVELCLPPNVGTLTSYLLVGNSGNRRPPEPAHTRTYTLRVEVVPPATPTPIPTHEPTAIPSVAPEPLPQPEPPAGDRNEPTPRPSSPPRSEPTPRPTAVPEPPSPSDAQPIPGVRVTELPPATAPQPVQEPQIAVGLSLRACYDRNQNRACDVDEGIGGLTVYVSDQGRGTLLGQALTDASGTAQLTVRAHADAQLSVSVPYFAAVQTTPARSPRLEPVMVTNIAALPALLP